MLMLSSLGILFPHIHIHLYAHTWIGLSYAQSKPVPPSLHDSFFHGSKCICVRFLWPQRNTYRNEICTSVCCLLSSQIDPFLLLQMEVLLRSREAKFPIYFLCLFLTVFPWDATSHAGPDLLTQMGKIPVTSVDFGLGPFWQDRKEQFMQRSKSRKKHH